MQTKLIVKGIQTILLFIGFLIVTISNMLNISVEIQNRTNTYKPNKKGYIKLMDNYDGLNGNMTIMEFFSKPDSLKKLKLLYNELNSNKKFKYFEILNQDLSYIGDYKGSIEKVHGDKSFINQDIDGETITPLKSIQLGDKLSKIIKIKDNTIFGNYFTNNDFILNKQNEVNAIMGHSYINEYKIGDAFKVKYLGIINFKCNVIDFLEENTKINLDNYIYNLNDYILMPALNIKNTPAIKDGDMFAKILYSTKSS
jgi:hypothetical protein